MTRRRELVIVGGRQWVDDGVGYHQTVATPVGPLRDARAPLTFLRGSGSASLAGLGLARGSPTYRIRVAYRGHGERQEVREPQ